MSSKSQTPRGRFLQRWNGVATIIFFAGIFLGLKTQQYVGFSTFGVALFMWVIGGIVANMMYGEEVKGRTNQTSNQFINCPSCNKEVTSDSQFCLECGTSLAKPVK